MRRCLKCIQELYKWYEFIPKRTTSLQVDTLSQSMEPFTVPAGLHVHATQPKSAELPNPYVSSVQLAHFNPSTWALHGHCPVCLSHTPEGWVPIGLQSHVRQPSSKPQYPSLHSLHWRDLAWSLHWHCPVKGSQNWLVDPKGLQLHGLHPSVFDADIS